MSGPAAAGAAALPRRVMGAPFTRAARARAGGVLDALLQGRAWIALVGVLLAGIVFFNVDLLELNRDIARTADKAAQIKRENSGLRLELARLASSERIQRVAAKRGLELPAPGDVRYRRPRPGDARRAAGTVTAPGQGSAPPVARPEPAPAPTPAPQTPPVPAPTAQPQQPTTTAPTPSPPPATAPQAPAPGFPAGGAAPAAPTPTPRTGG